MEKKEITQEERKAIISMVEKLNSQPRFKSKRVDEKDFTVDMLSEDNIKELKSHGMIQEDGSLWPELHYYIDGYDGLLNIVTGRESWNVLAGRHWTFNLKTNKIELIALS